MHQFAPTDFDDAVARYCAAERELSLAAEALRALLAKRSLEARTFRAALDVTVPADEAARSMQTAMIQNAVANHFGLHPSLMKSPARPNHIVQPRQMAMFLCRLFTNESLQEIGAAFGGRDHGTVIHACAAVKNRAELDPAYREELDLVALKVSAALGLSVVAEPGSHSPQSAIA